jgi:ribosomal protein S6--L-glutamate ligase
MRMLFLTATRVPDVPSPLLTDVADRLRRRGHDIAQVTVERTVVDVAGLVPDRDLYLLKSHTELGLSIAAALDEQGARLLNPVASCAATQDKLRCHRRLSAAGVPVPHTVVTGDYACARSALSALEPGAPAVLKPLRGHRGVDVEVIRDGEQLRGRPAPASPLLVQQLVTGPGEDLKVYVVGQRVWAVRKPFSTLSFTRPGHPVQVSRVVEDIALRAGAALGLGLYGLDMIESPHGPVVVDLNYFPGYKGCAGVAGPMAAYIDAFARGHVTLALPALRDRVARGSSPRSALKPVS